MLANGSTTMDRRGAAVGRGQLDEHSRAQANRIRADRTGDVLEGLLAKISEIDRDLATDPDRRRMKRCRCHPAQLSPQAEPRR